MVLNLPSEHETHIYVSDGGFICIEQKESLNGRCPVVLLVSQISQLIKVLPDMLAEAQSIIDGRE